ncbi:LacI family transcriptional regulator [Bifidobacterium goeldii]|uniref:LacI family transcriptional regulator n=2 Tax=Bifidobacterium goeldii TaxID=2306975 RepID=A0A430FIZ5_9BIFI|nr:LacI family transcriptional regulator [Bifidobacterium goeldii]
MVRAKGGQPSIRDVAQYANVSVASVSRYLNNGGGVGAEKRQAIAAAIEMLHYQPNPIARALAVNEMSSISVILSDISLYGPMKILEGIEEESRRCGYLVSVSLLDADIEKARETVDGLARSRPLGCVIIDLDRTSSTHALISYIRKKMPTVLISDERGQSDVELGAYIGGYEITKYLLSLGHKTVHHVSVPVNNNRYTRTHGWRQALQDAGAPIPEPIAADWDCREANRIGEYLSTLPDVTAVFAGNDEVAAGVIRGLTMAGKRVPEDISVAGFDDNPIASLTVPSITTWRQNFKDFGFRAVRLLRKDETALSSSVALEDQLRDDASRAAFVDQHLIVRESTTRLV